MYIPEPCPSLWVTDRDLAEVSIYTFPCLGAECLGLSWDFPDGMS